MLSPSPPPPPPPPLFDGGPTAAADRQYSYNPSHMIIAAIVAFAIIAAASIYLLLRSLFLSRSRSPSLIHHLSSSSSSSSSSISLPTYQPSDQDPKAVIDSLPLFSLSSSNLKSSTPLDCAVCLSPFQPSDQLRFLPSCRHAFHSECIDTWLKSSLSCPLCRSAIRPYPMPSPPQPPPPSAPQLDSSRSESFRVEIGSVSRRTDDLSMGHASHVRSYSLGSSFEYVVEEDIEAVLERVRRPPTVEKTDIEETPRPPPPPGPEMADIAGASQRSWLREYVDRLTSSASSSFTSLRFSQRWSQRFDTGAAFTSTTYAAGENWDLERNLHLHLEEDDGGFSAFYRWLIGA